MPPAAPCFAIRRPAVAVFTLDDYASSGIMSVAQAEIVHLSRTRLSRLGSEFGDAGRARRDYVLAQ